MPRAIQKTQVKKQQQSTAKATGGDLRIQAQALLTTTRNIERSFIKENDPEERCRLRGLLNRAFRKLREYRRALESVRGTPFAGPEIEELIQLFLLIENECRIAEERRPS